MVSSIRSTVSLIPRSQRPYHGCHDPAVSSNMSIGHPQSMKSFNLSNHLDWEIASITNTQIDIWNGLWSKLIDGWQTPRSSNWLPIVHRIVFGGNMDTLMAPDRSLRWPLDRLGNSSWKFKRNLSCHVWVPEGYGRTYSWRLVIVHHDPRNSNGPDT